MRPDLTRATWLNEPAVHAVTDSEVRITTDPGTDFTQMRIFHLAALGDTTAEMGRKDPPQRPVASVPIGFYACSPLDSSFTAVFDRFTLEPTCWTAHPA